VKEWSLAHEKRSAQRPLMELRNFLLDGSKREKSLQKRGRGGIEKKAHPPFPERNAFRALGEG